MRAAMQGLQQQPVRIPRSKLPPPVVTHLGGRRWRLENEYPYLDGSHTVTVPAAYRFDLSSVPRPFWVLIAPFELSVTAPLLHDFLYGYGGAPPAGSVVPPRTYRRSEADQMFKRIMELEGVPAWRRALGYAAVRVFGGSAWKDG